MVIAVGAFVLVMPVWHPSISALRHDEELSKKHAIAHGIVRSAEYVSYRTGGRGGGRQVSVFKFSFTFTPANAGSAQVSKAVEGVCYADTKLWKTAEPVIVEYNPENTAIARIQGARLDETAADTTWLGLVLVCVIVGLLLIGFGIWILITRPLPWREEMYRRTRVP